MAAAKVRFFLPKPANARELFLESQSGSRAQHLQMPYRRLNRASGEEVQTLLVELRPVEKSLHTKSTVSRRGDYNIRSERH